MQMVENGLAPIKEVLVYNVAEAVLQPRERTGDGHC